MNTKNIIIGVLATLVMLGNFSNCSRQERINSIESDLNAKSIQIDQYRDSNKRLHTKYVDATIVNQALIKDKIDNDLLKDLPSNSTVTRYINTKDTIYVQVDTPTEVVYITDTITNSIDTVYRSFIKDDDIFATIEVDKDSTKWDIQVNNDIDVVFYENHRGLFKSTQSEFLVRSNNKYSTNQSTESFLFDQVDKKFGFSIGAGATINTSGTIQPGLFAGFTYRLFKF